LCYKCDVQREKRNSKSVSYAPQKPFSYRPPKHLLPLFYDIVEVSKRSKASILHESLDEKLPELKTNYAPQLKKLKQARRAAGK